MLSGGSCTPRWLTPPEATLLEAVLWEITAVNYFFLIILKVSVVFNLVLRLLNYGKCFPLLPGRCVAFLPRHLQLSELMLPLPPLKSFGPWWR